MASRAIVPVGKNRPERIAQAELLRDRILRMRALEAVQQWKQHQAGLAERLAAGAHVESGPFTVDVSLRVR